MKKIAVLMTLVVMLFAMPLAAYAERPVSPYAASNPATPNWDYAASITTYLHDVYGDGSTVECVTVVFGSSSVTSITIEQTLQKEGFLWIYSKYDNDSEWTLTKSCNSTDFCNEKTNLESGKYRLKNVITLKTANDSEKITIYSDPLEIP